MPVSAAGRAPLAPATISFEMRPVPPFRLDLTAWVLRRRPDNLLDRWDGHTYRRALPLENVIVELAIQQVGPPSRPRLAVTATANEIHANSGRRADCETVLCQDTASAVPENTFRNGALVPEVCRMPAGETQVILHDKIALLLGTQINLDAFYALAKTQKHFGSLIAEFAGLKPPRYPTIFEALLNAVSCQQVSLHVGILLLNRLVQAFGKAASSAEGALHACPSAEDLANVAPGTLRAMGYSRQKERAILELSRSIAAGELNLESLNDLDDNVADDAAFERLTAIRGIGRWSAEYALLRGMGRLNIFPGDDVGGWNKLQKHLRLRKRPSYEKTRKLLAPWKSYAGLIYFHFLLDGLPAAAELARRRGLHDKGAFA